MAIPDQLPERFQPDPNCDCPRHELHIESLKTLVAAIEEPDDPDRHLYALCDRVGDDTFATLIVAMQWWIDAVVDEMPFGFDHNNGMFGFKVSPEHPAHNHPAFQWATRMMAIRANDDEATFHDMLKVTNDQQLATGICSVLYLCAHFLIGAAICVVEPPPVLDTDELLKP